MTTTKTPQDANKGTNGPSLSTDGLGGIMFGNARFVESMPHGNSPPNYACEGCAFVSSPRRCSITIDSRARAAFGGDCDERNVIYVEAPNFDIGRGD